MASSHSRKAKGRRAALAVAAALLILLLIVVISGIVRRSGGDRSPDRSDQTVSPSESDTSSSGNGAGRVVEGRITGVREKITADLGDDLSKVLTEGVFGPEGLTYKIFKVDGTPAEADVPGTYSVVYSAPGAEDVSSVLTLRAGDVTPPVITGAYDRNVAVGDTFSYRNGVSASDDVDGAVEVSVDATAVDLNALGSYPVIYSAVDSSGNRAEITVTINVVDPDVTPVDVVPTTDPPTQEELDSAALEVLNSIIDPSMSDYDKAYQIFLYVNGHIRYVGTSDKSSWQVGAYVGLTEGKGDCYNYFALSKELLTLAGIPNIDMYRVGGTTDHYWQLVNVGTGWYHFDACPHPDDYPITAFLITEQQARDYTAYVAPVRDNYYVYDYDSIDVTVEGTP